MNRTEAVLITAALVVVAWGLMYLGWRRRTARQSDLEALPPVPDGWDESAVTDRVDGAYVSTTFAQANLERVTAHGLGMPSNATMSVAPGLGLLVARVGAPDVFIPVAALRDVRLESVRLGKVAPHGLLVIEWTLGDRALVTAFRTSSTAARQHLLEAARELIPATGQGAA